MKNPLVGIIMGSDSDLIIMNNAALILDEFNIKFGHYFRNKNEQIDPVLTHFSNGGYKMPNFGINIPYVSIGYGRRIEKPEETFTISIGEVDIIFNMSNV